MAFNTTKVRTPPYSFPTPLPQLGDTAQSSPARTCWAQIVQSLGALEYHPTLSPAHGSQQTTPQMPCSAPGHQPGPANTTLQMLQVAFKADTTFFLSWAICHPLQDMWLTTPQWTSVTLLIPGYLQPSPLITSQACGSLTSPGCKRCVPLSVLDFNPQPSLWGCPEVIPS